MKSPPERSTPGNMSPGLFLPTLRWKIGLVLAAVLVIAGGGFMYFAYHTGMVMLDDQASLKAHAVTDVMKSVVEQAMISGDSNRVQQMLDDVTRSSSVKNAFLIRPDGDIRRESKSAGTLDAGARSVVEGMKRTGYSDHVPTRERDSMYAYVVSPLMNKPVCTACHKTTAPIIGYVGLRLATEDFRTLALEHRELNIVMSVLIFSGVGGAMFVALLLLVIRPIRGLHSHIRQIEADMGILETGTRAQFPLLDEPSRRDEIADLCRDFNNLMRRLNVANERISELHNAQLEHANRLATTGEMAASMAHEIKNPVAGVLGALQVIASELKPDDERREILSEMRTQLERVTHVLNDLLVYARPTPPVFEEIDILPVIDRTSALLTPQFRGKSIVVECKLPPTPLLVTADKKQLQQVIWNIMLNGVQALESAGTLTLSAQETLSSVILRFTDTGKGIPHDALERIFRPFYTTKHKGTGLGMTISKRIVEAHHGSISVESELGRGTTVTITLPRQQEES